ncbi:DDT domain-containing protein DDB_G0282237-like [Ipomoea triloba]|uniref:DDT domain-containing protein DDB_G0282237-like n=1 Tax=Ipomoea triloba TaxID=35885 RepID=UPI00125E0CC2|nr:DDT domain-containing protein DDB_G0282237-like [Ipomoea triloba]
MPLYKRKPFALLEKPEDLKPNELVFQVRFTKEIFRDYGDYLKRMHLYRQRIWSCKLSGKNYLTYEEALLSEKEAGEEVQLFPKELLAPVLRDVQFSMLSLNDLVNAIAVKLHGRLSVDTNLYGRKNSCIYTCRIVRIVEEDEKTQYEVEWMDKYDDISECTLVNEEDLIRKKLPYSRGVLKLLIRESTYRSIPWVLHDKLAKEHGIPTHPPPELESEISLKDGLVVVNKKRKRSECSQTDMDVEENELLDPKRKNCSRNSHEPLSNGKSVYEENGNLELNAVRYPIDDLLVQPSESDKYLTARPSPSRDFNAPMHCVGDLLMVWDFCTSFGRLLQLSPFSLEDFENAVCHSDSNVILIMEAHSALLRLLMKDNVRYFFTIKKKKRKTKITLVTWAEYLCDFLEMISIAELSAHISTIRRGHYGLLDVGVKLKILGELVAQAFMSDLFKEKLDEDIEKRQALSAARRDEALEEGRKRREEKERSKTQSVEKVARNGHIDSMNPVNSNHIRENGHVSNEGKEKWASCLKHSSDDSDGDAEMVNEKDAAENICNSSKKAALKNGMMELMQNKTKDQKQRAAHKLRKNQIKETIEKRSKEQRKEYLDREIEKRVIRTSPLGKDRDHNRYWFFRREAKIFVESSDSMEWGYYSSKEEVDALLGSLNVKGVRERALKKQLEKFYDKIILEIQKKLKDATQESATEESVRRRSTRVRAPPGENPALVFLKYVNKWKKE